MAQQKPKGQSQSARNTEVITRITVGGFKSINKEQSLEIRPLTILAGANSSGKSSIMQPLLLLKQTLEATYDPGALLLNGPNVKFTSTDQLLSRVNLRRAVHSFQVGVEIERERMLTTYFTRSKNKGFDVEQTDYGFSGEKFRFYKGMSQEELLDIFKIFNEDPFFEVYDPETGPADDGSPFVHKYPRPFFIIERKRCFLLPRPSLYSDSTFNFSGLSISESVISDRISELIHLPGLRGNPARTYPVTAEGPMYPGTFEIYVASVIGHWQTDGNNEKLEKLNRDLFRLGLAKRVIARAIDDTQVELLVNRSSHNSSNETKDMVSIADVGFGVSQTLPVVVALHAANPGQLIYIEQPEIHLHPRAQLAMAEVLADAAIAGKRLVVETHSSLLLLGIQTLVAEKKLPPELVKLHWFTQQEDGSTQITSADLDEAGAYGDWPEDFANV